MDDGDSGGYLDVSSSAAGGGAQQYVTSAIEALAAQDPRQALRQLAFGFAADPSHRPLYQLAAEALRRLEKGQEAQLFEDAAADPESVQALSDLGSHLVAAGQYQLAIPILERALALAPGTTGVATELAIALSADFQPDRARAVLAGVDLAADFGAGYLWHACSLLCNKPQGTQAFVDASRATLRRSHGLSDQSRQAFEDALDRLEESQQRLDVVPQPEPFVQHWHFVQYGAAILDFFGGPDAGPDRSVAGGRYVALWATSEKTAQVLRKLLRFLEVLDRRPMLVVGLPDRDSEILARAAAALLGLGCLLLPGPAGDSGAGAEALLSAPGTLVVAGRNGGLNAYPTLRAVRPEQTVFAFDHHWLSPASVTPDVSGLMSQACYFPWEGNIRLDAGGRPARTERDSRPPEQIAEELATVRPADDPRDDQTLRFYRVRESLLKGGVRGGRRRWAFHTDSPVGGSYFC